MLPGRMPQADRNLNLLSTPPPQQQEVSPLPRADEYASTMPAEHLAKLEISIPALEEFMGSQLHGQSIFDRFGKEPVTVARIAAVVPDSIHNDRPITGLRYGEWERVDDPAYDRPYFMHVRTSMTTWDPPQCFGPSINPTADSTPGGSFVFPEEQVRLHSLNPKHISGFIYGDWQEIRDPEVGRTYYYNMKHDYSQWEIPHDMTRLLEKGQESRTGTRQRVEETALEYASSNVDVSLGKKNENAATQEMMKDRRVRVQKMGCASPDKEEECTGCEAVGTPHGLWEDSKALLSRSLPLPPRIRNATVRVGEQEIVGRVPTRHHTKQAWVKDGVRAEPKQ